MKKARPRKSGSRLAHDLFFILSLLLSLPFSHPSLQELDDGFLHALRCVGSGKVSPDLVHGQGQIPVLRLFLLHHDTEHGIIIELSFLG